MATLRCEDTPAVCNRLRSKSAWVAYGEPVTWEAAYVSTAIFWCLGTADVIGPDDGFVHPHVCVKGRKCFSNQRAELAGEPSADIKRREP
jgi:hypothetical protein